MEQYFGTTNNTVFTYNEDCKNSNFDDLVEKYMLCDKKTLAQLLAMREMFDKLQTPQFPQYPSYPSIPTNPWPLITWCEHCTNPFHDCINCPFSTGGRPIEVNTNIRYTTNTTAQ